jgi:glucose-1-phosphate cytidylyltransferase
MQWGAFMQTVILCGGMGARLKEETEYRPKPMVHLGSRPVLWHIMKTYAHYGHTEFVLPLGYKGEVIKEYFYHYEMMNSDVTVELGNRSGIQFHQQHDETGWKVTMADTGENTLKGGRIKRVERYIGNEPFMLTYGDGVADIDISALLRFHRAHGRIATVTGINPTARFGELKTDGDVVNVFAEKPQVAEGDGLVSGGFFVFEPQIFNYLSDKRECDLEYGALEKLAREGELMVYRHSGFWACMDTLRDVEALNLMWTQGKAPWKIW